MNIPKHYFENTFGEFEDYLLTQPYQIYAYKPGDILFSDLSNHNKYFFYIIRGYTMVSATTEDGNKKVMCFYAQGTITNLLIDMNPQSIFETEFIQALTNVTVLAFKKEDILEIIRSNFNFARRIIMFQNELIALLTYHCLTLPYVRSETRLYDFLYMSWCTPPSVHEKEPETIYISQEHIAQYIGVTRTQTARLIKKMREENLIKTHRCSIKIIDINTIRSRCSSVLKMNK